MAVKGREETWTCALLVQPSHALPGHKTGICYSFHPFTGTGSLGREKPQFSEKILCYVQKSDSCIKIPASLSQKNTNL